MDALDFVARSEWPLVIGGAIWLLRQSIRDMFGRVNPTKVDAFGFKAEFERTLDKVEQLTPPVDEKKPSPTMAFDSKLAEEPEQLRASPEAVILESWRQLEKALRQKLPPSGPHNIIMPIPARFLGEFLKLSEDEIAAYRSLQQLRNKVAHSDAPVSRDDAIRFKEATERVLQRIAASKQ